MADSLISDLCKDVGDKVIKEVCLLHGVRKEAEKMEENLKKIKTVLKAADQREIESDVKMWLSELKNVAYDIEDVLDDWRIAELQREDESGTSQQRPKSKAEVRLSFISSPCFCFRQVKSRHDIAQRIKAINERLGEIGEAKNKFSFPTSNIRINKGSMLKPTSAYGKYIVVARQEEVKAEVIQMLVHGDSESNVANVNHIPIISLVGMGGIGKTTLARLVYDDDSVKGNFPKIIWVCVSNTFNEMNVAKAIAEGLGLKVRNDSTLHPVLSKIDGSIRDQKFLLVLDDVWEDSEGKWSDILGCLGKGDKQGSRILMTTRNSEFSKKMGADIVSVEEFGAEDAWSLFSYYAFIGDSDHCEEVKDIAEKLAEKCQGLPLALEVLGRHMATKTTRREWDDVLMSELWKTEFEDRVFNSLVVSYVELPSAAKRCFAFYSIFPKDTVMRKNDLIRLWMAQGYLEGGKPHQMEVLGEKFFECLVRRSFFRVFERHVWELAGVVTMHDLVHDFARYISNCEVAILDPSLEIHEGGVISKKLRHLAISGETSESNCPHPIFDFNALRTLFLSTDSTAVLKAVCSNKSYIRALDIRIYSNLMAPANYHFNDIGKLVHLRYLRLGMRRLAVLPKEICALPFLQTLDVSKCYQLETLPNEIGRLTSLRHLLFNMTDCSLPKGLWKLSSLQTLSYFFCSALDNEVCSSIEDLRDLNNLQGKLWLTKLNNVANVDEATRAELGKKTQIRTLRLEFGDGDASLQSEVLEALRPAEGSIEILEIWKHRGRRCPRWIGKMGHLKEVLLEGVSMNFLPEMGMLCFLEKLTIWRACEVKHVGAEFYGMVKQDIVFFPKLRYLKFDCMSRWEHWEGPNVITRSGVRVTIMPSLRCLTVSRCHVLQTLPRFLEHVPLEWLDLYGGSLPPVEPAKDDDYPNRWRIGDVLLPQTMKHIQTTFFTLGISASQVLIITSAATLPQPELREVTLSGVKNDWVLDWAKYCKGLRKLTLSYDCGAASLASLELLPSLEFLKITICNGIRHIGKELLQLSSLLRLNISFMDDLEEWEDPPPQLEISDESIELIRHGNNNGSAKINFMPSLRRLHIYGCPKLKALPSFLRSVPLEELEIADCPGLATWWINEAREDWRNWKSDIPIFKFPDHSECCYPSPAGTSRIKSTITTAPP